MPPLNVFCHDSQCICFYLDFVLFGSVFESLMLCSFLEQSLVVSMERKYYKNKKALVTVNLDSFFNLYFIDYFS